MRTLPRFLLWTALSLIFALVIVIIGARLWLNSYLQSAKFRALLGAEAGHTLRAEAGFMPLHVSGSNVFSDRFEALGFEAAAFSQLRADGLRADFDWRGIFERKLTISEIAAQRVELNLSSARETRPQSADEPKPSARSAGSKSPWQLDLRKALVREAQGIWGDAATPAGRISGTALTMRPSGRAWLIEANGGRLAQSGWPELILDSARLRWQDDSLFITVANLRHDTGRITVGGEVQFGRGADFQVDFVGIDVTPLLSEDWRLRLFGRISGEAKVAAVSGPPQRGGVNVSGTLRLSEGRLEALPILNEIATFTRTQRFRQIALSQASVEFTRSATEITGRNLLVESTGLIRVTGDFVVRDGQIDGHFQLGIAPAGLQWLPGSPTRVFAASRDGYLWTPVRVSGPLEHPSEDLSPRLIAAAGGAVLDEASGAVKGVEESVRGAAKGLLDLLSK